MSEQMESFLYDEGDEALKFSDLYIPKEVIGNGAFGTVISVLGRHDNKKYAVKVRNESSFLNFFRL